MFGEVNFRAILFDFYNTLVEIETDENDSVVWDQLARFLSYQGIQVTGRRLKAMYLDLVGAMRRHHERREHHAELGTERRKQFPEIDIVRIFQHLLLSLDYTGPDHFAVHVAQLFRALSIRRFRLFPDTVRSLGALRRTYKLGLVSDAQRVFLEPEMAQFNLTELFDVQIASCDHGFRKPDTRLFRVALKQLGIDNPREAVYVGDSLFRDVYGAHAAGMHAILLQRHEQHEDDRIDDHPDRAFHTLDEVVGWLLG